MSMDDGGWPYRGLVYSLFTPAAGFGILPLVLVLGDDAVLTVTGVLLASGWLATPPLLYLSASALAERRPVEWTPSVPGYTVAGILTGPLAAAYYLRRRYHHLGVAAGRRGWWVGVLAGIAGIVAVSAGFALPPSEPELTIAFTVAAACYALFPVAVYHDARNVRARGADWSPEPASATLLTVLSVATLVLPPVFALAYLGQRIRTVGLGS